MPEKPNPKLHPHPRVRRKRPATATKPREGETPTNVGWPAEPHCDISNLKSSISPRPFVPPSLRPSVPSSSALTTPYAELHCKTNFSFLRGASHPEELVDRAADLGYRALAVTDRNSLAGVVRMHLAAKQRCLKLLIGAEIVPLDAPPVVLLAPTREAYGRLSRLITTGRRRTVKGDCRITLDDLAAHSEGLIALCMGRDGGTEGHRDEEKAKEFGQPRREPERDGGEDTSSLRPYVPTSLFAYRTLFGDRAYLLAELGYGSDDANQLASLQRLSRRTRLPLVAANDVHYHLPRRRYLHDVLTCVRHQCTLQTVGRRLLPNARRHLLEPADLARRFAACPEAVERTIGLADQCTFSLDELRYEYPEELCPADTTAMDYLTQLTWAGARERYAGRVPEHVRGLLEHELALIRDLRYEPYFLTVWDLVRFARSRGILCQGRGSAANSVVCYCLGVTAVDPVKIDLLFERFVSRERNEPPDIDVDFEHERREEVFQYIYAKYGRERAALTAEVITYRPRSAIRDVGKALGLSLELVDALAKRMDWWDHAALPESVIREAGFDPHDRTLRMLVRLVTDLIGFPRHLSQHVGGFVITQKPLCETVPIENAAMPDRTFIEWDKDDLDALGMLKVDCLALGMLTAIRKCFDLIKQRDEGTEGFERPRRKPERDEEQKRGMVEETPYLGAEDGGEKNVSRFDCLEKSGRPCEDRIPGDPTDAGQRALRVDGANAQGGGVDSVQHCRGECSPDPARLHSLPRHGARIAGRTGNSTCHRPGVEHVERRRRSAGASSGDRSGTPGPDPQSPEKVISQPLGPNDTPLPSVPSSLPSVPPSLRPFVPSSLFDIPAEDPAVYAMICAADTIGVFQIESRAQMAMLPRLRPRNFYDLVVEVAIVRPGPIQGGMVHPYLRRRNGEEPVDYPNPAVADVLRKTLGVPLFQEQAMRLAVVAAGFTPGEADQLRRAMGAWRRNGIIEQFHTKLVHGMLANGYPQEFAEQCFRQISGFGEYGFPESHAASFALLVYASAWLKRYYPAAYTAALLNAQPMGFYAPAQLVRDARNHGVEVLAPDVNHSAYDCTLEEGKEGRRDEGTEGRGQNTPCERQEEMGNEATAPGGRGSCRAIFARGAERRSQHTGEHLARFSPPSSNPQSSGRDQGGSDYDHPQSPLSSPSSLRPFVPPSLRLGFRLIRGLSAAKVRGLEAARAAGPITSLRTLARRDDVSRETLLRLAAADAFRSLGLNRRDTLWEILALHDEPGLLADLEPDEPPPAHPPTVLAERVVQDYDTLGLSLEAHPIALLRDDLATLGVQPNAVLKEAPRGRRVRVSGLVLVRQRPATANGTVFMTLEDETEIANLIIRATTWKRIRRVARTSVAVIAEGIVERQGPVVHVTVRQMADVSERLAALRSQSRDFH